MGLVHWSSRTSRVYWHCGSGLAHNFCPNLILFQDLRAIFCLCFFLGISRVLSQCGLSFHESVQWKGEVLLQTHRNTWDIQPSLLSKAHQRKRRRVSIFFSQWGLYFFCFLPKKVRIGRNTHCSYAFLRIYRRRRNLSPFP